MGCGASATQIEEALDAKKVVLIIGGGYGGVKLARALDAKVNTVLIDKKDHFFHCMASLRGACQPDRAPDSVIPYNMLLKYGIVLQATVLEVQDKLVVLSNGRKLAFDACVCSTGWAAGNAFWKPNTATAKETLVELRESTKQLAAASSVLLIGGGPISIELAGEILEASLNPSPPEITIISSSPKLMGATGVEDKLKDQLADQLMKKGVKLVFGERVVSGVDMSKTGMHPGGTVVTYSSKSYSADLIVVATGPRPVLPEKHPFKVSEQGRILVEKTLQCTGASPHFFALGDCAETGDAPTAYNSWQQAGVLAKNIVTFCEKGSSASLAQYKGQGKAPAMLVPIGKQGAGQFPFMMVGPNLT
eukprot:CAMPEP_0197699566 /NCGR_PEP_ID=MMETSP1338-20131121/120779_1 /TAXON_ID=43686 ORGANISM="Pelagodinium beii, Strain RCC1491" /NCGR_SAMPLE_ID=MMETSP1338 /ASSEMBLY_ACC=CAM_ASM_000754 /LENGTH=361 /DNA_ID=CAMNT_0043283071 /DNA_START=1 /DNA_END=1082 /DNA_ORIENTATION=+